MDPGYSRRNMDLIRDMLIIWEGGQPAWQAGADGLIVKHACTPEYIGYHNYLLVSSGLMDGHLPQMTASDILPEAYPTALTWAGHDFLNTTRNNAVWDKVKNRASTVGVDLTIEFAIRLAKQFIEERLGL